MLTTFAILCIGLMIGILFLNFLGLPANWMALGVAALWTFFVSETTMSITILGVMGGLAIVGEVLEMLMVQIWGKKYGSTSLGIVGGIIGALVGAILCAPILFGLGAFFGALLGAFMGSLAVELLRGRQNQEALRAAWGTMLGRFGGSVTKTAIGCAMVALAAPHMWT